jgi:hypothetical protein
LIRFGIRDGRKHLDFDIIYELEEGSLKLILNIYTIWKKILSARKIYIRDSILIHYLTKKHADFGIPA